MIVPLPLSHIEEREIAMGMPRQPSVLSSQHFWTDFVCWETPEFRSHISAQKHAMPFSVLDVYTLEVGLRLPQTLIYK